MIPSQLAIMATAILSLIMVACSSDSNLSEPVLGQNSAPQGLDSGDLPSSEQHLSDTGAVVSRKSEAPLDIGVSTDRIAAQLEDGVLDNIVLGTETEPVTEGSWPKLNPDMSWTWQLLGDTKTDYEVDVYVLDMFQQLEGNVIERLHAQNKVVICYFSAGTYEPWRPDVDLFANVPMGNQHYAYPNELWIDITSTVTAKVMVNRMDMAVALGCDGIELDNVDGYTADLWTPNPTGFNITVKQELAFQRLLANEAHKRNLAVALKNSVDTIADAADYFDLAINEVCFAFDECGVYKTITDAGKPVFHVEYDKKYINDADERAAMCAKTAALNMRSLVMPKLLDGSFRLSCDE